ncbi:polysaccharide deacetylase family protein [Cytophagales bacterium LB-30]|uniref:Polysaccharide deacetylase family protein n=1 Tax=Shiella aurantiaca TaxID=3058365 RepID=A0ABT8F1Z5_9BACT|nr:polysaccharide deacetylase family protein [Shiella aurantiaca]MDN4164389.1 polysaccharide deacetylase family protein [Shiella aurantiaca]
MIFHKTPFFLPWLFPHYVWHKERGERKIYLTFDDGPIPEVTEFVLEQLDKYQAKATFFCVGHNIEKHPAIFHQVVAAGHSVGNHTFHHVKGTKTPLATYLEEVQKGEEQLGQWSQSLFRPPYGRLRPAQAKVLKKDYQIIMWDVLTGDYEARKSAEICLQQSIKATRGGSIVLFHDSIKSYTTLQYVLPRYLGHFQALGYTYEAL